MHNYKKGRQVYSNVECRTDIVQITVKENLNYMLQEKIIWLLYLYFKGKMAVSAVLIWFIIPVIQDPVSVAVTLLQKGGFLNRDTAG